MGTLEGENLVHLFTSPILKYEWPHSQALNRDLAATIATHGGERNLAIGGW